MLVNAYAVVEMLRLYRVAWISGRYAGGKTSLAFRLAYELLDSGEYRYLLTNCRSVWSDDPSAIEARDGKLDAVVILDEAGLFLRTNADAERFLAFLRKFNVVVILASVWPPATAFRHFRIQRVLDFRRLGLPLWLYRAVLRYESVAEQYWFAWLDPAEIYGIYDTRDIPVDDAGIGARLQLHLSEELSRRGYGGIRSGVQALETSGRNDVSVQLADVAQALSEFSEYVAISVPGGGRRRRR